MEIDVHTDVALRWRPFQLRPEVPSGGVPWRPFALEKFGGEENMGRAFAHVTAAGGPAGVRFDFDGVASAPNTVDAHRLILHAAERDRQMEDDPPPENPQASRKPAPPKR